MNADDIIFYARSFIKVWCTNDPYEIAERFGIKVLFRDSVLRDFTAQTVKINGYPTIISINDKYSDFSKRVLCAHELGHALLHGDSINYFATNSRNIRTNVEYEANLFAAHLLIDDMQVSHAAVNGMTAAELAASIEVPESLVAIKAANYEKRRQFHAPRELKRS